MTFMDIFYYNKWTDLDLPEVRDCFEKITEAESQKLKKGDAIWLDREPYHPSGKVYGFSRVVISGIKKRGEDASFLFGEKGPYGYSSCGKWRIYKIKDLKKLTSLLGKHKGELTSLAAYEQEVSYKKFKEDWLDHGYPNI